MAGMAWLRSPLRCAEEFLGGPAPLHRSGPRLRGHHLRRGAAGGAAALHGAVRHRRTEAVAHGGGELPEGCVLQLLGEEMGDIWDGGLVGWVVSWVVG